MILRLAEPAAPSALTKGCFASFGQVWVQDSSAIPLPDKFSEAFGGSANHTGKKYPQLKVQIVASLLDGHFAQLSLSGFDRNDQAAAQDILAVAQPGDLILRDLGYFALACFKTMHDRSIFFLSRYRYGTNLYDRQGKPLNLHQLLRRKGFLDRQVFVGEKERLPVRLLALPVPDQVANHRRREARAKLDHGHQPKADRLALMGWNILITNVSDKIWTLRQAVQVYYLRWRIELVFKAGKSHLKIEELNFGSEAMLRLSFALKLLYSALLHACVTLLEIHVSPHQHPSLLRLARIFRDFTCLWMAAILSLDPYQLLDHFLQKFAFYEKRHDRANFFDLLANLGVKLG